MTIHNELKAISEQFQVPFLNIKNIKKFKDEKSQWTRKETHDMILSGKKNPQRQQKQFKDYYRYFDFLNGSGIEIVLYTLQQTLHRAGLYGR